MNKPHVTRNFEHAVDITRKSVPSYLLGVLPAARNERATRLSFDGMRRLPDVVLPEVSALYCGYQTVITHGWDEKENGSRANAVYWLGRPGPVSSTSPVLDGLLLAFATGCRQEGAQLQRDLAQYPVVETIRERNATATYVTRIYQLKERVEE